MKKAIIVALSACLMALGLLACGGSHAATLSQNFTDTAGTNFTVEGATRVKKVTNGLQVTKATVDNTGTTVFTTRAYVDNSSGLIWGKFVTMATSTGLFLQISSTNEYVGAQAPVEVRCNSPFSQLTYQVGSIQAVDNINDNCVIKQGIVAISNP